MATATEATVLMEMEAAAAAAQQWAEVKE